MAQVNKPTDYFNTKLYTGNGSTNAITGVGFQPDWVWIKDRDNANDHKLYDGVRGATEYLISNSAAAEATQANGLTSFDSDGFTLGSYGGTNGSGGGSGPNFVSWNWLASNTTASNTDGTATSTVSALTTSGFSIVKWTQSSGATFGHGLNQTPEIIIHKRTSNTSQWTVYTNVTGSNQYLELNSTIASSSTSATWDSTTFTNFTGDSGDWISYCFHSVKGFSKMGTYIGNGNADGTFVYTGFKPAWVLVRHTDSAGENSFICDNKREGYNAENNRLIPNLSTTEQSDSPIDILSNGFKARETGNKVNGSGKNYIYMAFAESPLVGTNNIPATAR